MSPTTDRPSSEATTAGLSLAGTGDAVERALEAGLRVDITPGPNVCIGAYGAGRRGSVSNWGDDGTVKRDIATGSTSTRCVYHQLATPSIAAIIDFAIPELTETSPA